VNAGCRLRLADRVHQGFQNLINSSKLHQYGYGSRAELPLEGQSDRLRGRMAGRGHPDGAGAFRQLPSVVTWMPTGLKLPISRSRVHDAAVFLHMFSTAAAAEERGQRRSRCNTVTSPDTAHAAKRVRLERHHNAEQSCGVRLEVGERVEALYQDGCYFNNNNHNDNTSNNNNNNNNT
jgi:hypothetical protein